MNQNELFFYTFQDELMKINQDIKVIESLKDDVKTVMNRKTYILKIIKFIT